MDSIEFIESGILESYVLGAATEAEISEVEEMATIHENVRKEIDEISQFFEKYAEENAMEPDPTIRPFFLATVDYIERMNAGEIVSNPPLLSASSTIEDYKIWLDRADMILPDDAADVYAKIIGNAPEAITAIVWLKDLAPQEAHKAEYERFLIVEGSCEITISDNVYALKTGDFLEIPLFQNHHVTVTSIIPCKVVLQRVAA